MVLFTFAELIDLIIMVFAIGFIFSKIFKKPIPVSKTYDPLAHYEKKNDAFEDLKWGIIVAAPAVVFHELAHKFVAIYFGAQATLVAPVVMYAIVILMIMLKSPVIFFVGGYVTHTALPPLQSFFVSVSGPLTNLLLWFGADRILKSDHKFKKKNIEMISMTKKLNMFLFIFNMIPIPGFDGFNAIRALFNIFF
ncbi:hypothetical protein BVX95_00775 [archaeon D22]|nr:hypothetical protein BVX95_00775 [archaeon D22]